MKKIAIFTMMTLLIASSAFCESKDIDTSFVLYGSGKHCYLLADRDSAETWMALGMDVKELSLEALSQFPICRPTNFFSVNLGLIGDIDLNFLVNPYKAYHYVTDYAEVTPISSFGLGIRCGIGCDIDIKPCPEVQLDFLPYIKIGLKDLGVITKITSEDDYEYNGNTYYKYNITTRTTGFLGLFEAGISPSLSVGSSKFRAYLGYDFVFRAFIGAASNRISIPFASESLTEHTQAYGYYCYYDFRVGITISDLI